MQRFLCKSKCDGCSIVALLLISQYYDLDKQPATVLTSTSGVCSAKAQRKV